MEKILIGSIELSTTKSSGKPVVELYSTNTALQFPELRLFDLSQLIAVDVDPNVLVAGERIHHRFFAYYTTSDKINQSGNPYRDVAHLEPIDKPATSASTDTTPILAELRKMNVLLMAIATTLEIPDLPTIAPGRNVDELTTGSQDQAETAESILALPIRDRYRYENGLACSPKPNERAAFEAYVKAEGKRPPDVDTLRDWIQDTPKPRPVEG